jgi:hypothetical protein
MQCAHGAEGAGAEAEEGDAMTAEINKAARSDEVARLMVEVEALLQSERERPLDAREKLIVWAILSVLSGGEP